MHLAGLWLTDFRCYRQADLRFPPGITVIRGANAQGKTSLLEAIAWVASGSSFRGVADQALVRSGSETAVLRAETVDGTRVQLLEAEIHVRGRNRVRLNRHSVTRAKDRAEFMRVTVFAPDDLRIVKGGPGGRRDYLDDLLVSTAPRFAGVHSDYERLLRQRNALLRSGLHHSDDVTTLEVFDTQLARAGAQLTAGRLAMLERLTPLVVEVYRELADDAPLVQAEYESTWRDADDRELERALLASLRALRRAELERRVTLAGPHRDEWRLHIGTLDSRLHASQGEQRTLSLALRIAGHRLATEVAGAPPILLLDDVFSELDEQRSAALLAHLDLGQTIVTTAGAVPPAVHAERSLRVDDGQVEEAA
jgi:DNA replication and repair protein RecF